VTAVGQFIYDTCIKPLVYLKAHFSEQMANSGNVSFTITVKRNTLAHKVKTGAVLNDGLYDARL